MINLEPVQISTNFTVRSDYKKVKTFRGAKTTPAIELWDPAFEIYSYSLHITPDNARLFLIKNNRGKIFSLKGLLFSYEAHRASVKGKLVFQRNPGSIYTSMTILSHIPSAFVLTMPERVPWNVDVSFADFQLMLPSKKKCRLYRVSSGSFRSVLGTDDPVVVGPFYYDKKKFAIYDEKKKFFCFLKKDKFKVGDKARIYLKKDETEYRFYHTVFL